MMKQWVRRMSWASALRGLWIGVIVFVVLALVSAAGLFAPTRATLTDLLFNTRVRSEQIVIAAIDDDSLARYGRSPTQWTRRVYADLVERLSEAGARVVAFELLMVEPNYADRVLRFALTSARQGNQRTRFVLAAAGIGSPRIVTVSQELPLSRFDMDVRPVSVLGEVADYIGFANGFADPDGKIRRELAFVYDEGDIVPSFSLATFMAYLRIPASTVEQVIRYDDNVLTIANNHAIALDENGQWRQNYFGALGETFPVISVRDILNPTTDLSLLRDKIVIIGLYNATGAVNTYRVPTTRGSLEMPAVEIQAHAIESLLRGATLRLQDSTSSLLMVLVLCLLSAAIFDRLVWYLEPIAVVLMGVGLIGAALYLFASQGLILNLFDGALAIILPALVSVGADISREIRRRQAAELLLDSVVALSNMRLDKARIAEQMYAELKRVLPLERVALWLHSLDQEQSEQYEYPPKSGALGVHDTLARRARAQQESVQVGNAFAIPIVWQSTMLGALALEFSPSLRQKARFKPLLETFVKDITPELANALLYEESNRQRRLFEAVLLGSPTCIALLKTNGCVQQVNDAFRTSVVGLPEAGSTQTLPQILKNVGLSDAKVSLLDHQINNTTHFEDQLELNSKTYNLHAQYLTDLGLWVVVLADVTTLAELNRLKRQMLLMVSHDLRNPLANIMTSTAVLRRRETELDERTQRTIGNIDRASMTMHAIINDLLDIEQLRSAQFPRTPLSLDSVVRDVVERYQMDADSKGQTLEVEIADALPQLDAHAGQMAQIVTNLLTNAIKYTPENGKVCIRLRQVDGKLRLEVEDTGIGIPSEAHEMLFDEFYRVKSKDTLDIPGSGLGLSITKSVVEAYSGRIWLDSTLGKGTTFYVELPAGKANAAAA
jgi:signal transduction histidine kinase